VHQANDPLSTTGRWLARDARRSQSARRSSRPARRRDRRFTLNHTRICVARLLDLSPSAARWTTPNSSPRQRQLPRSCRHRYRVHSPRVCESPSVVPCRILARITAFGYSSAWNSRTSSRAAPIDALELTSCRLRPATCSAASSATIPPDRLFARGSPGCKNVRHRACGSGRCTPPRPGPDRRDRLARGRCQGRRACRTTTPDLPA